MSEHWVLDASPLIVLARAGFEDLLLKLPEQVVVPRAVESEIQTGPAEDPARRALVAGGFPIVETPIRAEILTWDLGLGETAVLSYAHSNQGWTAILDDRAARTCARSYSIPYKGTLSLRMLSIGTFVTRFCRKQNLYERRQAVPHPYLRMLAARG